MAPWPAGASYGDSDPIIEAERQLILKAKRLASAPAVPSASDMVPDAWRRLKRVIKFLRGSKVASEKRTVQLATGTHTKAKSVVRQNNKAEPRLSGHVESVAVGGPTPQ
jgi:hypothetical protein